jgi:hypothetical protein
MSVYRQACKLEGYLVTFYKISGLYNVRDIPIYI